MKNTEKDHNILVATVKKTADLGVKLALNFVPGATTAYELTTIGVTQAKKFFQKKQEKRIEDFHRMLLTPGEKWDSELAVASIDAVDYHSLLTACVQEIEDEKVELYAILAKNTAFKKIDSKNIRFFILALRDLSFHDIEEMRIAYIAKNFKIMPSSGSGNFKKELTIAEAAGHLAYGRRMMELHGFIQDGMLNPYGEKFVKSCYLSNKLTPASINKKEWKNSGSPLLILCYELGDSYITNFGVGLIEKLRDDGYITTGPAAISRKHSLMTSRTSILIFKDKPERIIDNFTHIEKIIKNNCVAIQLCDDFPSVLEPLREIFKEVVVVSDLNPKKAAEHAFSKLSE